MMKQKAFALPIKLYIQKHLLLFIIIMCGGCFCFLFLEVFFGFFTQSSNDDLLFIVKVFSMLALMIITLISIRAFFSRKPNIIIHKEKIELLNAFKKTYEVFRFEDIKDIGFGYGNRPQMYIYLKNRPQLSFEDKKYPIVGYRLSGIKLRSRQVASMIEQAWTNHNNQLTSPIILPKAKAHLFDWRI